MFQQGMAQKPLLTYQETCELLQVSKVTLWRMTKRGDLRVIRVAPRHPRILFTEIERWLAQKAKEAAA